MTAQLPTGIKCAAGSDNKCCVVSFVTTAGYGNCVVVCQSETTGESSTSTDDGKTKTATQNDQTNTKQQNQNPNGGDKPKNNKRMIRKRRL